MRAKAIRNTFKGCPPALAAIGSPQTNTHITIGCEYEVHALSMFRGVACVQIVNDLKLISWLPSWFFVVCDPSLPTNWICGFHSEDLQMVVGPDFIANSEASYNKMVELNPQSVASFWHRLDKLQEP